MPGVGRGYYPSYVWPQRVGFSAILVIDRVLILAMLVLNSSLELGLFLKRSCFFIIYQ